MRKQNADLVERAMAAEAEALRVTSDYARAEKLHRLGRMRAELLTRTTNVEAEIRRLLQRSALPSLSPALSQKLRIALKRVKALWPREWS